MSDPILGPTEVWDTDALTEVEAALLSPYGLSLPRPFRCRTGAVPGTKGTSKKVLSFLLRPEHTADGVPQFYVSPLVGDSGDAVKLLTKMVAEALREEPADQQRFARTYLHIEWSTRTPVPLCRGDKLPNLIGDIIQALGPRPHGAAVTPEKIRTPKTTALLRAACPYCDQPVRATLSALQEAWPVCVGASKTGARHAPVYLQAQLNGALVLANEHIPTSVDSHNHPCP